MQDVVSITDPSNGQSFGVIMVFHHRHQIGGCLTGVVLGGERVDHRYGGVLSQFFHVAMCKTSIRHAAQETGENLGGVADGFGFTKLDVVLQQRQGTAAEPLNADFERDAGAC